MMHEEDERPPNEKSHAYHFNITYNGHWYTISPAISQPLAIGSGELKVRVKMYVLTERL